MADTFLPNPFLQARAILFLVVCCCGGVSGGVVKRSDDVNTPFENLQVLVQQQAAVISSLQASLTALQNSHIALENKVASLSRPVAFSARFSADNVNNGIPLSPHATLKFDLVVSNAGNGYNPANGIFTAPVAGYYVFSVVLMEPATAAHPTLDVSIVKNGTVVDMAQAENVSGSKYEQGSTFTAMHLAVGDQIWIRQENGNGVRGSYWTVFTGFLVQAE